MDMDTRRLSSQQQRIQQIERDVPEPGAAPSPYRVCATVDVRGPLDAERLTTALRDCVAEPWLRDAFDSVIERVSHDRARWFVTVPAAVADEHTLRHVVARAVDVYRDGADAASPRLTYDDYVAWQAALLDDLDSAAAGVYWSERACPDASEWELPFARDRRGHDASVHAEDTPRSPDARPPHEVTPLRLTRQIDRPLARALRAQAREARVSLSAWLLAAWQVLLWRHLDRPNVQVGVRLDGRAHPAWRDVLGPCARDVPVDVHVGVRDTLADIARRTAAIVREHRLWQDGFTWEALDRGDRPSGANAYHAFGFNDDGLRRHEVLNTIAGRDRGDRGERPIEPTFRIRTLVGTLDRFDVSLHVARAKRGVSCTFGWNDARYRESDIASVADRYLELLAASVRDPRTRVAELGIVAPGERIALLARARGPAADADPPRMMLDAFRGQVVRDPHKTAVISGAARLTYADVDGRAQALAARLQAAGIGAGDHVAICLPRTVDQLVAIVGVLAAGAAFVPLDPSIPWERLAWTLTDAGIAVLIATPETAAGVPQNSAVTVIAPAAIGDAPLPPAAGRNPDPASPAYLIYTSGSTGRPKGVVVSHRNLAHSTRARALHYREPVDTYLLVSPLAFDSAMAGVFWTMNCGGTLVIAGDDEHNDPAALRRLIARHQVSHVLCLPSLFAWILATDPDGRDALESLRVVIVAGERCPSTLVTRHRDALPGVELHNEYGPTECSVWSTVSRLDTEPAVTIGRPIAGAEAYVADRPWQLAPAGVPAELLIGGAGVADGYRGRPELTADRFVPDGWSGRAGARVYRTGDRVRWLPDGTVDFLGRIDRQIKLRGYRIELEEIEAAIGSCAHVRECAVTVHGESGKERLVAFVVPDSRATGADATLGDRVRRFLGERLPPYMLPGAIVLIDALPKTPNGKVDRARMPAPPDAAAGEAIADPPTTASEQVIAALWRDALGKERFGIHDNFFDLGGHSLMAIAIYAQLRSRAPALRLIDLFEHATVHTLAAFIDTATEPGNDLEPEPATVAAETRDRDRRQDLRRRRLAARIS